MIEIKSHSEVEKMRIPARIVADILAALIEEAGPGVTTATLDGRAEKMIGKARCRSAFKNYRVGNNVFPAVLCASINEEVVHGIPANRELREGDILSLDFGVEYGGYYGDSAVTLAIGEIDAESQRLMDVTERCLFAGIDEMHPGARLGDIGAAVQELAEGEGFGVVRDFVGHGIGRALHEEPQVPNVGTRGRGHSLKAGMVLAIEPMINMGTAAIRVLEDGWTAVTADGSRSAHFEHTIVITDNGPEVLTGRG